MYFKTYFTRNTNEKKVAEELYRSCYDKEVKIFMYFASTTYDFYLLTQELSKLIGNKCIVVGCTSSGEISSCEGLTKGGVSVVAFGDSSMKVEAVGIEEISKVPLMYRMDIIEKLSNLGYRERQESYDNLTGLLLVDGLKGAEEKLLSVLNSIFEGKLNLIGGSAGDDLKFEKTLLALNGRVMEDSAIFTMIKSNIKMTIYRENIFDSQGIEIDITKADEKNRKIFEIDNKPAKTRYAELLGVNKNNLESYILKNPIGRKIGESIYISSIASIDGESLNMYAQVFENSRAEILKAKNPLVTQKETLEIIKRDFNEIYGVFCVNCILRFLQFEKEGILQEISRGIENLGDYGGFVSYGEQYNKQHLNQTLTLLVMGR
jgi:hypothetical protein